jgi:HK97 family phage portal protein
MYRRATATAVKREFQGIPGPNGGSTLTLPGRNFGQYGAVHVNEDIAMAHSGVWASTRLRADLMSTFPVSTFRDFQGMPTDAGIPPIIEQPGGPGWDFVDWMWASQHDLDYVGNTIGLIKARNGISTKYYPDGLPAVIELADSRACSVVKWKGQILYRINGTTYKAKDVYHERQFPWSGTPVGLSPLMYAAASVGEYISLQKYSNDWFAGGGVPKAWMKNTIKRLGDEERDFAKQWYRDTVRNGDLMVTGNDWEYNMIQAEQAGMEWLEGRRFGLGEVARFFGVPSDLIDAAVSGQAITYANISQRNLEFLIMHLGPAVKRREKNLSQLLPQPRYVKLNTDALLRLDPQTRQMVLRSKLETWQLTNDEAREIEDLKPLTDKEIERMTEIYGKPKAGGAGPPTPGEADADPALAPGAAPAGPAAPAKPGAPAPGKAPAPVKPPAKQPVPAK